MPTPRETAEPQQEREPRFIVLAGNFYEVDDILAALHGQPFTATLHRLDRNDLGAAQNDEGSLVRVRAVKTAALQRLVAQSTDGLRDNLPNRAAILMALDESGELRFNSITEFLAYFAQLTPQDATHVQRAVEETRNGARIVDASNPLGGHFSQITSHSLEHARDVQWVLGEGSKDWDWPNVTTAMIERAILRQDFAGDDWLQMLEGDNLRMVRVERTTLDLPGRAVSAPNKAFIAGLGTTVLGSVTAIALNQPELLIVSALGGMGLTLTSMVAIRAISSIPEPWLVRMATTASTVTGWIGLGLGSSVSERRAGGVIKEYKKLFEMTKARVEELRQTAVGRLGLLLIQEIIGQESGALSTDEETIKLLRSWMLVFWDPSNATTVELFNEFCESYPNDDFNSIDTAHPILVEFNRFLRSRRELDREVATHETPTSRATARKATE